MFQNNRKLLIPGPTGVKEEVLLSQTKPMISHRGEGFSSMYRSIVEKIQSILNTKNNVFVLTSSGTGAMEAATRNFIKKKSLHVGGGEFAERWYEIAKSNNREADLIDVEWGKGARLEE
ncbi:MAG: alanine--glyoxylate aminotransferase family protein, partial [Candidatus Nealsonbacteria bacterium]